MKDPNWIKCTLWGDSKEIIKRIPDNSIDFILTDSPYNLGKHSTGNIPLPASNPGDIIFDPFMGTGSTGEAALTLGRRFIGVEKRESIWLAL